RSEGVEHERHLPGEKIGERRPPAPIGNVQHVYTGHHPEQLAVDVLRAADTTRRHVDLTGIGFGVSDQFGNGLRWERRMYLQDSRSAVDARNRCDVANEIEAEMVVECYVPRVI